MASVPTDPYELLHWNMQLAHDTYEEGYMIILGLLDNPPRKDLRNFLGYCEAWALSIAHHHDTEEATVFRALNRKMDFSHEQEQHKDVHAFLDNFLVEVKAMQADPSTFDPAKLTRLMLGSQDALIKHFREEVIHIEGWRLKRAGLTEAECLKMIAEMEKHAKAHGDPFLVVPFMRSHTAPQYKNIWPPMPWILRKVMIPHLLAKKHSGYWKYAPYAMA
ncbi:hypothetical protein BD413DRAFT_601961 [Trametes elegans]|nr:hypothetical protein BD413DRAFT_601961 [Trametes elegans]